MSAETDLVQAFMDKWDATGVLTTAVPGGIYSDQATQAQRLPPDTPRALPYALLSVKLVNTKFGHRFLSDFRRVTVEVYGTGGKVAMGAVVDAIHTAFDYPVKLNYAPYNVNRYHRHTRINDEDDEEVTGEKRHGEYVRLARISWIMSTEVTQP